MRYMSQNNKAVLREFSKAIAFPLYKTDAIKWPIRSSHVISVVNDIYATEYLSQLRELVSFYDPKLWCEAVPSSLSIWRMVHHIIDGLEKSKKTKEEIAQDCLLMIKVIENVTNYKVTSALEHRPSQPQEVLNLSINYSRISGIGALQQLISLATLMWAYSESVYFQGREICCEYHGPYSVNDEKIVIRDYVNLDPRELWPCLDWTTKIHSIRVVTFHKKNLQFSIDAFNNVDIHGEGLVGSCSGGLLFVNGRLADSGVIPGIINEFSKKMSEQLQYIDNILPDELYCKYAQIFWYRKKALADFLGYDWKPPQKVYELISNAKICASPHSNYRTSRGIEFLEQKYDYSAYV